VYANGKTTELIVLMSIKTNAFVASILYSIPNGGAQPPRVYEIYPPSRTLIISSTDIINEMTDEIKAKGQAKLRLPNKTIIGAVQKGTRT
jgi:hypothetical protein